MESVSGLRFYCVSCGMLRINILDYSSIDEGSNASLAFIHTTELAKCAEKLGYHRFWVSEHHRVLSVAGSSPEMLMMHLATSTQHIRIGSGGVMLPHYSPYKVAENFRVLEAIHPNRIDLGIGRSPSYQIVNQALNETKRRRLSYDQQVEDLYYYLSDAPIADHRFQGLTAMPIIETMPEIWMLGSSSRSAEMAAKKGAAYAFSAFAHSSKAGLDAVLHYRDQFLASPFLDKPKVMIAIFAVIAETDEKAEILAQGLDLWLLQIESTSPPPYFPAPQRTSARILTTAEQEKVDKNRQRMLVGSAERVSNEVKRIARRFHADEITIIPHFFHVDNRIKGITLLAEALGLKPV